ncbi:MAG TPA: efflux RND transporter periplasmic adaptor subunit [Vicinamibacterales bacterium]|nr:efflux RND transporter periplasmic adaptor subunit [Vicinamibacterales bacterium]
MRRTTRARWIVAAVAAAAVVLVGFLAFDPRTSIDVQTLPVSSGLISHDVLAAGTLEPVTTVDVGAQANGTIAAIDVDFNSIVHAGQVLARIDPSSYRAQLDIAKASLAQSQADEGTAQAAYDAAVQTRDRIQTLASTAVDSVEDLDNAKLDAAQAEAALHDAHSAVERARAAVDAANVNLQHTVITSPINGIVVSRNVDVGQTLISTMQTPSLFKIAADLKKMQVQVDVDQSDVAGLKPGEHAAFTVASYPGVTFQGTLKDVRLDAVVAAGNAISFTGIVVVDNHDERLRPGMTAVVQLMGLKTTGLRIPNRAFEFRPSPDVLHALHEVEPPVNRAGHDPKLVAQERLVWEYDGKKFTPVPVEGGTSDGSWTQLIDGPVHSGDRLVTAAVVQHHSRL